jgi:rhamnose transport system substrate-binding protein
MFPSLRRAVPLAAALALSLGLAACGGTTKDDTSSQPQNTGSAAASADPNAPFKEGLDITFVPKQLNNAYFDSMTSGGKEAMSELKGEFKLVGPNESNASSQVSYINTLIQQKPAAIAIAANDANAVCPALNQARAAGIKVVTFDSDASPSCRDAFVNQTTIQGIGETLVKMTKDQIGSGEFAILSATPNATNQNAWIEAMKKELAKPENAGLKLVDTVYGNDQDQKSFQETQGLLQAHPNLKAIVAPTSVGIAAAARYVSTSSYKGKVVVTGLGLPNEMRKYVKDGTVKQMALWDVPALGYLAGYTAAALASGQITGAEGEKFKAGKLNEYTIGADGEIVLGPPTVFTAENIDQYDF